MRKGSDWRSAVLRRFRAVRQYLPPLPLAIRLTLPILITVIALGIIARFGYSALTEQRATSNRALSTYAGDLKSASALPFHLIAVRAGLYNLSVWGSVGVRPDEMAELRAHIRATVSLAEIPVRARDRRR